MAALAFLHLDHRRSVVALHRRNGLQIPINRPQILFVQTRERLPGHWRTGNQAPLTEACDELILAHFSEASRFRIAGDVRRRPRMSGIIDLGETGRAAEARTDERARVLTALR